jgi:large subunit ribosomal protein L15
MAGLHKHKWSYTVKYMPDHFGSNKWHPPSPSVTEKWLNVDQLGAIGNPGGKIDLVEMGYDKLLGSGTVQAAFQVRTNRASKSAIEKIRKAGGSVEVLIQEPPKTDGKQKSQLGKSQTPQKPAIQKK